MRRTQKRREEGTPLPIFLEAEQIFNFEQDFPDQGPA